ncbi:MAG: FecR domain-containing protein [Bacteroidota bacterium]
MDKQLVTKYFDDRCSPEEAARVEEWLRTSEGQRFLEAEMERDFQVAEEFGDALIYPAIPSDNVFSDIKDTIEDKEQSSRNVISLQPRTWFGIAAAILLSIFVILFVAQQNAHLEKEQEAYPQKVTTEAENDTTLTLKDGSIVHLNSDSELSVHEGFDEDVRSVSLVGKAYFEIKNNADLPFVVQTNHSYIRVLGTKFEVEAYPGLPEVKVKVDEGKVRFFSKDDRVEPIDLVGNESGVMRMNVSEEVLEESTEIAYEQYEEPLLVRHRSLGEENPKIKFVDNRLFIALNYLERQYDVDIELENGSLKNKRFTLTTDRSLLGAVERIADSLNLKIEYDRNKDKLYLKQRE